MDKPIIFSAPMVRAILAGSKTQTRRVIKFEREYFNYGTSKYQWIGDDGYWHPATPSGRTGQHKPVKMKYQKGDLLWVKETWAQPGAIPGSDDPIKAYMPIYYKADEPKDVYWSWRSSRFMPRWASRILLEVERVGVAYVQEITNDDAVKEGVAFEDYEEVNGILDMLKPRDMYSVLWERLNAKRGYAWDNNPLVWVIDFKRIKPAEDVTY